MTTHEQRFWRKSTEDLAYQTTRRMSPERAKEIIRLGSKWHNYGKHCTPNEDKEVRDLWMTMPGYTCWYDALLRIAKGEAS